MKKYYSISEVSEIIDEPKSTIRYWQKALDINLKKDSHFRRFTVGELKLFKTIKRLSRTGWFTLEGIKAIIEGQLQTNINEFI